MIVKQCRLAVDFEKQRAISRWIWLPYLCSPFLFGFVVKIFPVDHFKAGLAVIVTLILLAPLGLLPRRINGSLLALIGACTLIGLVLSIPFWGLKSKSKTSATEIQPVYSYRLAKANPDAFAKWWNFFVEEVVRIQPLIFDKDPDGAPFNGKLPFLPKPGIKVDFYKGSIAINNQGFRGDDFSREKADVFRILTLGDSVTFGQTAFPEGRPWSAVLQDLIARDLSCSKPIQVVNGGVNAFHLRNGIDRLRRNSAWLKPDIVMTYFGWNSMEDLGLNPPVFQAPVPPETGSRTDVVRWYALKAAVSLYNESVSRTKSAFFGDIFGLKIGMNSGTSALLDTARKSALHSDYQELIEHAKQFKYKLILLSFNTAVSPDGPEDAKAFYQAVTHAVKPLLTSVSINNTMVRELAQDTGTMFIDTGKDLYGKYDDDLYLDIVHFTPRGDVVMAKNVFRDIRPLLLSNPDLGCRPR